MFSRALFGSLCLISLVPTTLSCSPPHANTNGPHGDSSPLTIGTDGPAAPETLGYTINHFALIVNDLTATRNFYGDVLGMRHIFTFQASETFSVMYMGHSQGGQNGTGYMTGDQLFAEKDNLQGLIEFVYLEGRKETIPSTPAVQNTFSHVGLIVPNITATQERMIEHGVSIVKRVGKRPTFPGPVSAAFGLTDPDEAQSALDGIEKLGFNSFLIIADPDGNLIEVQQQI